MGRYVAELARLGYVYRRDSIGEHFEKGTRRITVTHVGPLWSVFVNERRAGGFTLIARSHGLFDAEAAHNWMLGFV